LPPGKNAPVPATSGVAVTGAKLTGNEDGGLKMEDGNEIFGGSPKRTGETPVLPEINPETGRLSVQVVEHLHRLLGGDGRVEDMVLRFIADRYQAKSLLHLPPHVAKEIMKRPADFIRAAKQHCEPELGF
jgi:hypothetical protein